MKYLPVGLDVRHRICIVVGGGQIGTRKVSNLIRAEAAVTVLSPDATEELAEMAREGRIRWRKAKYSPGDFRGAFLVVAATDDEDVNRRVVEDALEVGALVCDASSVSRSQVIFGALHEKDGITLAVFTDGRNPARARKVRDRIAALTREWEGE